MDSYEDEVVAPTTTSSESPLKDWRVKFLADTLDKNDFIEFFQKESRQYFEHDTSGADSARSWRDALSEIKNLKNNKRGCEGSLKCMFKEAAAKEGIIDVLMEFILGDNPNIVLEKLRLEGATSAVCGKVFKIGEPTYSCRECGMDPTCVLCVNCFKQSAHRYHKYKMSTSGGGGCCDCGDEEAWKKDHYCEEHLRGKENSSSSTIITDAIKERCEIAFVAILTFCVNYLEIETNASLKCLDGDGIGKDYFCTVLYNDESHTFDQVIQTLTKIAKVQHKEATEIVASIDREGRAVVKCDSFNECAALKEAIEKQSVPPNMAMPNSRANQSLRVNVLHIRAVACQQFALQLLTWFQEFLVRHSTFRQIFARIVMDKKAPYCIRHILEYDVALWKTARTCWHRLLISGMLMEYDNKMALAQEFSKNYATIVQDFISDDHDHSYSIVSLSVQLFTVPSIAHYLIAQEGIFYKLLHTFYHKSIEDYMQNKTLHFSKNVSTLSHFKRAAYILYDLRYILSFKPDFWTQELREGFNEGCKALLRVLNAMQGMESVTRQTGQHMDYEPEWECAFNLHIKLANTISLVLEWAATDKEVLEKLCVMVMRYLMQNTFIIGQAKKEQRTVENHIAECLIYDVSSKPVSIHLPLSRFFAGIYLHLGQYGLNFDMISSLKRTPEEIMEPILCTQVMMAQVHSGMWRRNGYSLLHQLYFYRNVRCRTEMLDRDIVGMQIGASLIESNEYLIHLLNKFNLIEWIQPDYEDSNVEPTTDDDFIRQLSMIDEFLELLIVIIGERFMPGVAHVTEEDRTKKEIMQLLCIKSYSHSELNRALPDSNNDTALEDVIDSVAVFKKPQKTDAKGVYELREELYDGFNMYFYHYTKEDKSKSEETQRLRRKNKGELVCCPPPKLPKLTDSFVTIANLLQCDVMMHLMKTILERALDLKRKSFQENHLQKILFLIGYGLQEEESNNYPFLSFYQWAHRYKLLPKLEELSRSARVEAHRDFILWTIKKFKDLQAKQTTAEGLERMQSDDLEPTSSAHDDNGSGDIAATTLTSAEQEKREKEERARLAAERRAKILAQMQSAQNKFMTSNAEMFASANDVASDANAGTAMEWQDENLEGAVAYNSTACLGVERRLQQPEEEKYKCILCFEEAVVSKDGPTLVYSAFVQKSKVLKPESNYAYSVHTSSCGHVMHVNCWQEYYNNEESKEIRRPRRHPLQVFPSSPSTEFQCPYCRCLSNTVLPLTPPLSKYSVPNVFHAGDEMFPIDLWIEGIRVFSDKLNNLILTEDPDLWSFHLPEWLPTLKEAHIPIDPKQFEKMAQPTQRGELPVSWINFVQHYMKSLKRNEDEGLLNMWHTCVYTVQALEVYLRSVGKPLKDEMSIRHQSCLSGLIRACCLYSGNLTQTDVKSLIKPVAELLNVVFKHNGDSVLEWNCFSKMVSTIMMVPNILFARVRGASVVANGSLMDFYTLQVFLLANVVKSIVLFEQTAEGLMDIEEEDYVALSDKQLENISIFFNKYNIQARQKAKMAAAAAAAQTQQPKKSVSKESSQEEQSTTVAAESAASDDIDAGMTDVTQQQQQQQSTIAEPKPELLSPQLVTALLDHVKMEMREFLRCSCLFFHFVTDVEFPDSLATSESDTFENMCKYLGLNSQLESYFDNATPYATIMEMFASHHDITNLDVVTTKIKMTDDPLVIMPCNRTVPQLVNLPEDYSDLINSVSDFSCPNNEREEMKTPTMCLMCGEILCAQSYCCQPDLDSRNVGACTYHAYFCGAEIAPFLRIRDCQIVYLGKNKGCFVQPPYLDDYGETDQGLRRGNPLRLCPARYSKIHLTWLAHGLHEEIARLNDHSSAITTQWHHM
ncbi:E3 ubiquitin-protein ligase UBR1 isoform X1 [Stomoxys calcitrans]|uniref:E3 ubiquitin-protein ligase UBR1 isoform X1 n=1 Tax=Stomoxys calcitrans TaxID=35570 RepID=UPI0027E390B1|nr:E3 ubiquitin-protein ligase UBR1 isoform X1 [Stomoxys calcitrans]XP_059224218.1 E3 ubiquitin-protein ligase UBR1 isoform X1 [Stomoxys calcitrans]XP_059224219.1 E3 ubiquitin-protein ligase UBR1 isoform X1 [Stomoxys calcitrans]XP_059224220.1 E3 ubiquitin-protein ligase UBR1 isoform X1 [Stomoxys calcitrans]XP_059224221.1 E3 ubiquitin-protein ligase UBR1 isoform X1 [Stomoxys calcitrans]